MTRPNDQARLAVLIDADNAPAAHLEELFVEIAKYGRASVRRAYGNWTAPQPAPWKAELLEHSIQPMQQFAYTQGKNATDSALIIDAMDLLHSGTVDGFCLVSSDSDFTRLAARIREEGLLALGFGQRKTPPPFVKACDTFVYLENLVPHEDSDGGDQRSALVADDKLDRLLAEAVASATRDDDWAHLGEVGSNLSKLSSDFDSRTYGFSKLKDLMSAHPSYEVSHPSNGEGRQGPVMVRRKPAKRRR